MRLHGSQQYVEAEAAYREALRLDPRYVHAHGGLGSALHAQGRYSEAEAAYREALRLDPRYVHAHGGLGSLLHAQARYSEAEAAYREALRLDPRYVHAHGGLGSALHAQGRYSEAEAAYREALRLDPRYVRAHSGLGSALHAQGRYSEAEAAYREALRLDPRYVHAHGGLGSALNAQGRYSEAETAYRESLRLDPGDAHARAGLGNTLGRQGRHAEAEAAYREALRLDSGDAHAHAGLGNTLGRQGRHAEAAAAYREAIRLEPMHVDAYEGLGKALGSQALWAEAETTFREALQLDPENVHACDGLGNALGSQGRHAEAADAFREALRLDSGFVHAYNGLGKALIDQGRLSEAESSIRKALRLDPTYVDAHDGLGIALSRQGRHAEAEDAFREALGLDPMYVRSHNGLGHALRDQGRHGEAEAAFREALRLDPGYVEAHNGLGDALLSQGRPAEAEAAYREALRLNPAYALAHVNLGLLRTQTNRPGLALASHARAVRLTLGQPRYLVGYIDALQVVERSGPLELLSALSSGGALHGVLDVALEVGRGDLGTSLGMLASRFDRWVLPGRSFVESLLRDALDRLDHDDADATTHLKILSILADAREGLVWASLDDAERAHWLELLDGLAPRAARLCLTADQPGLAAEHLERGLAIDLTQSALVKLVDLRSISQALKSRYEQAVQAWEAARYMPEPGSNVEAQWLRIRQARLDIYLALLAIRQHQPSLGEPTRWADIAALSHDRALAYLSADAQGGLGVMVHQGQAHPIPGLEAPTVERLEALLEPLEATYRARVDPARRASTQASGSSAATARKSGLLDRLFGLKNKTSAAAAEDDGPWNAALDTALRGLWDLVMGPVVAQAQRLGIKSLTMIPGKPLSMLPLQLAWRETPPGSGSTAAGRRYALQDLCIAFAPSAGLLALATARSATTDSPPTGEVPALHCPVSSRVSPRVLAILDDTILDEQSSIGSTRGQAAPTYADQIQTELERIWCQTCVKVLRGEEATPQAVFEALEGPPAGTESAEGEKATSPPDIVIFFGHGTAEGSLGTSSSLQLASSLRHANGQMTRQKISLEDLLRHTHRQSLWVVLACEAARGKRDIPRDEAVSFAGGLLQAGVGAVVAATVPIAQRLVVPLALKMLAHHAHGLGPAQALRQAQRDLLEGPGAVVQASAEAHQRRAPQPMRAPTLGIGISPAAAQDDGEPSPHLRRPGHWALQCFGG